jgi:hypothetical protein
MIQKGEYLGRGKNRKRVLEVVTLSNGWILVKTEDSKSPKDFLVRTVTDVSSRKFYTPKHAHFVIDFFGKLCQDKNRALKVFDAIIKMWQGVRIEELLDKYKKETEGLVGYDLEYVLYALNWILEQEDINFNGRPSELQEKIDEKLEKLGILAPSGREGSQLAISLFCDIVLGVHPVEAFLSARLDIIPRKGFKK